MEALTTAQIAAAAGLSVGGLYRFFPDKQAIVDAIALRHMELFQNGLAARLMLAIPDSPRDFLHAVIDAFVAYLDANPVFRTVAFGAPGGGRYVSRPTREAYAEHDVVALVQEFVTEMFGLEATEDFAFRLRLAIELGDRLLAFAVEQSDPAERARVVAEARRVLGEYLFPG